MPQVAVQQIRKLGTHALTRNGIPIPGAGAMTPAACWNFALTGTVTNQNHPDSPSEICQGGLGIFDVQPVAGVQGDYVADDVYPFEVTGLTAHATLANYPGCAAELGVLNANIVAAVAGNAVAQANCTAAMVPLIARRNGLVPGAVDDRYQLHMRTRSWYGWDHWALSLRAEQVGRPRIYIQTVTGTTLNHACTTIWDEGLPEIVVNLQELHATQVAFLNMVNAFGDLCVTCGANHGLIPSNPFNAWHRCTVCRAVYCPTHGAALPGGRGFGDRTRACNQLGCAGRTAVVSTI